jgi:hypothetical protein
VKIELKKWHNAQAKPMPTHEEIDSANGIDGGLPGGFRAMFN